MNLSSRTAIAALSTLVWMATVLPAQLTGTPAQTGTSEPSATAMPEQVPPAVHGNSKVRIVRISETKGAAEGAVQLDRNTGSGFENAITNLPIVEGCKLRTGAGVAEVEFEDNSTMRLAPDSLVEFTQLELLPSGAKVSTVNVKSGIVYVSLAATKGNEFTLTFDQQKLSLQPSTHIRLNVGADEARLAVFDGTAQMELPAGTMDVGKKKTLTIPIDGQSQPVIAKNVKSEDFDAWDHNSADYHKQFSNLNAVASSPYSYGVSDLMYYGSFINAGGCGQMWQPYFVSAAWSPFANGTWAWYPGAGYSWVSPYPWGWMPFHYGSWSYCQGAGWGWQPGGSWNGLNNTSGLVAHGIAMNPPRAPLGTPRTGGSTLVPVNNKSLTLSSVDSSDKFVFRNDSAGMGVPRGSLGPLNRLSEQAGRHGSVSTVVYSDRPSSVGAMSGSSNGRMNNMAGMGAGGEGNAGTITSTMRRGYAPPVEPVGSSMPCLSGGNPGMNPCSPGGPSGNAGSASTMSPSRSTGAPTSSPKPR